LALTDVREPGASDTPPDPRRSPLSGAEKRWLAAILLVAAVLRIWWFAATKSGPPTAWFEQGDQFGYWYYGNEIANGRGYVHYLTGEATAYYPVGFPVLLAILYKTTGWITSDQMLVTGIFHIVLSVASCALTFVVGRRMLGVRAGLVAAAVLAVWPNIVYQVGSIQLETAYIFFTMVALAVIVDHDWRSGPPSRNRLLVFGALLGAGAMVRPFAVFVLVGLGAALLVTGIGMKRAAMLLAWPVLVLVVVFTPWTIRNAVQLNTFAPSSTNMGDGLCLDRNDDATGGFRWTTHDGCVDAGLPEAERNRGNTDKALRWIVENPRRELVQIGRRFRIMFESDNDGVYAVDGLGGPDLQFDPDSRRRLEDIGDSFFAALLWLAVPGIVLAGIRSPRAERWLVGSTFFSLFAIPLTLYGNPRFHVPLAPFGALAAAASVMAVAGVVARVAWRVPSGPAWPTTPKPGAATRPYAE